MGQDPQAQKAPFSLAVFTGKKGAAGRQTNKKRNYKIHNQLHTCGLTKTWAQQINNSELLIHNDQLQTYVTNTWAQQVNNQVAFRFSMLTYAYVQTPHTRIDICVHTICLSLSPDSA